MQISQVVLALSLTFAAFGQGSAQSRFIVLSTQASVGAALPLNCQEQVAVCAKLGKNIPPLAIGLTSLPVTTRRGKPCSPTEPLLGSKCRRWDTR